MNHASVTVTQVDRPEKHWGLKPATPQQSWRYETRFLKKLVATGVRDTYPEARAAGLLALINRAQFTQDHGSRDERLAALDVLRLYSPK